jgi:hypothetical protein
MDWTCATAGAPVNSTMQAKTSLNTLITLAD